MYSAARSRRALRQVLEVVGQRSAVDSLAQAVECQIVAQLLHHAVELPHVGRLVPDCAHQEAPVARLQFGRGERQRADLDAWVLRAPFRELVTPARAAGRR